MRLMHCVEVCRILFSRAEMSKDAELPVSMLTSTQKSLSNRFSLGRGGRRFSTESCLRKPDSRGGDFDASKREPREFQNRSRGIETWRRVIPERRWTRRKLCY